MKDLFEETIEVYWSEKMNNLMIINPPTLFMLATIQGSNNRKLCVNKEHAIKEYELIYIGEL